MVQISGGDKLAAELARMAEGVSNPGTMRAGFLPGGTYPDGTSTAMVAVIQDYGAPAAGIPPRPFFRNVVAAGKSVWGKQLGKLLKAHDMDARAALDDMGAKIAGEIRNSINNGSFTPLKPATVRRKGFDKPLIDTSNMVNSIDHEVV